jgi:hypothetical protein
MQNIINFSNIEINRAGLVKPGIYVFYLKKICIYVGSAERPLGERLREHWRGSHNDRLTNWIKVYGKKLRVEVREVTNLARIKSVEQGEMDRLSPLVNKVKARK